MKLEQQVVSLELAKKLKELGVKQDSLFYHYSQGIGTADDLWERGENHIWVWDNAYSAFTVAELGEVIGAGLNTRINMSGNIVVFHTLYDNGFTADTEADARAKMLIYLLENNLINK